MNAARKYVVSTTLKSTSSWRNSTLFSGDVVKEIRRLKEAAWGDYNTISLINKNVEEEVEKLKQKDGGM